MKKPFQRGFASTQHDIVDPVVSAILCKRLAV